MPAWQEAAPSATLRLQAGDPINTKRKKAWWRAVRRPAEVLLTRIAGHAVARLPRRGVLALARALGELGYAASPRLRAVGRANLDLVFGDTLAPAEKTRILRESCRTFALVAVDLFWFSRNTAERVRRWVTFETEPRDIFRDKAYICITGHFGNWEIIGLASSLRGFPFSSVATPLKNPVVDELLRRAREATGQTIIEREGAVRGMLRVLKDRGRVALLLDQNTQLTEGGVFIDFFGVPATVSPAGASLALRTGTEILFGFCIPRPDGGYHVHVPPGITPPPYDREQADRAALELTNRIARVYEQEIRAHPECWLWMYKRWKHIRPGDTREGYPFYSSGLSPAEIPPDHRPAPPPA